MKVTSSRWNVFRFATQLEFDYWELYWFMA